MSQHPTDMFRTSCGAIAPLELNVLGPGFAGGERRVFEQPFVLVGRDERGCLRLEDGAVSRRHAYLQQLGRSVFCVDLGSRTGIRWGGELRPADWLRPEQGIQIGPFTVELARAAQAEEAPGERVAEDWDPLQDRANDPRSLPRITVEVGNEVLSRLCMNRALVLVGSSPACRVRLRDARVSRYHCSLVRTPQGVWLVDLLHGSGACLNGESLRCALVKEGDRLQVGPYVLRVWYPDVRTETPPLGLVEIPARTPMQPADEVSKSKLRPSQDAGGLEPAATEMSVVVSALQAELDKARERQQDVEVFRQQLGDRQAECDRLGVQVRGLEAQVAEMAGLQARLRDEEVETERLRVQLRAAESQQAELESRRAEGDRLGAQVRAFEVQVAEMAALQTRLEVSEASVRELDAVRGERDRWQTEAQNLQARLTADLADQEEQVSRLTADLQTAQAEGQRLHLEQQSCRHAAEQAAARVSDLERALTEAAAAQATALDEARVGWALERQALEARLELERQSHDGAVQAAVREVQARAAAERQEWRLRLEGAEQQIVWERGIFQEQSEQIRQQAAKLQAERDRLVARIAQAELRLRAAQQCSPDEAGHAAELHNLRQQAAREQVFVQLSGIRLGHLLPQTVRAQHPDATDEQAHPRAPLVRERAAVEEQSRLTTIAQEVQAAWGEAPVGQEQMPAIRNQSRRVEGQASEGEKAVEPRSAPVVPPSIPGNEEEACTPSDSPPSSAAPLEESQSAEDAQGCLPQRKDSRPEPRPRLWRQILGFVLGK